MDRSLSRSLVALGEANESLRKVEWLEDLEVGVEQPEVQRELVWGIGAGLDDAVVRPVRRHVHRNRQ